jgi:hypothetical protein
MVNKKDWLTELREKNAKITKKASDKSLEKVITDFYQISKPGSKEVEWVCRRRK